MQVWDWICRLVVDPTAVFTAALFAVTFLLWRSTRNLVLGAEEASEKQLRAYVAVMPVGIANIDPSKTISFGFNIVNAGQTPAHDMEHSSVLRLLAHPLPPKFPFPTLPADRPSRQTLPQGIVFRGTAIADRTFTQAEIIQLLQAPQQGTRLYILGQIDYTDAFGNKRWTRYCISYSGHFDLVPLAQNGDWSGLNNIASFPGFPFSFEFANQHNEAD